MRYSHESDDVDVPQLAFGEPMFDVTSINAVESIFREPYDWDPWGCENAQRFIDVFLFSRKPRCVLPVVAGQQPDALCIPALLRELRRDIHIEYCQLDPDGLGLPREELFANFDALYDWALDAQDPVSRTTAILKFTRWLKLHRKPWIKVQQHWKNAPNGLIVPVQEVCAHPDFDRRIKLLGVEREDMLYAMDVLLRRDHYLRAANGQAYISHEIRSEVGHPTAEATREVKHEIRSWGTRVLEIVQGGPSPEQFAGVLHDLRGMIRDAELVDPVTGKLDPGKTERYRDRLKVYATWNHARAVRAAIEVFAAAVQAYAPPPVNVLGRLMTIGAKHIPDRPPRACWKWLSLRWEVSFGV